MFATMNKREPKGKKGKKGDQVHKDSQQLHDSQNVFPFQLIDEI